MKKILVSFLLAAMTLPVFAEGANTLIEKYQDKGYVFYALRMDGVKDCINLIFCSATYDEISYFMLFNSGWSDDTVKKFMRKLYLEKIHDYGHILKHDGMKDYLEYYIKDFLPKSDYDFFGMYGNYKFELKTVEDTEQEGYKISNYYYTLTVK